MDVRGAPYSHEQYSPPVTAAANVPHRVIRESAGIRRYLEESSITTDNDNDDEDHDADHDGINAAARDRPGRAKDAGSNKTAGPRGLSPQTPVAGDESTRTHNSDGSGDDDAGIRRAGLAVGPGEDSTVLQMEPRGGGGLGASFTVEADSLDFAAQHDGHRAMALTRGDSDSDDGGGSRDPSPEATTNTTTTVSNTITTDNNDRSQNAGRSVSGLPGSFLQGRRPHDLQTWSGDNHTHHHHDNHDNHDSHGGGGDDDDTKPDAVGPAAVPALDFGSIDDMLRAAREAEEAALAASRAAEAHITRHGSLFHTRTRLTVDDNNANASTTTDAHIGDDFVAQSYHGHDQQHQNRFHADDDEPVFYDDDDVPLAVDHTVYEEEEEEEEDDSGSGGSSLSGSDDDYNAAAHGIGRSSAQPQMGVR